MKRKNVDSFFVFDASWQTLRFQDGVATELQGSRASVESRTLVEGRSSVEGRTSLEDSKTSVEMGRIAAEGSRSSAENSKAAPQYFVFPL